MDNVLKQLYQETILDHGRKPRNFKALEQPCHLQVGHNPLCGDKLTMYVKFGESNTIEDISFEGSGCAISLASASLLTETLKGKTLEQAKIIFNQFLGMLTSPEEPTQLEAPLKDTKLRVLSGVRHFPTRVKCATLSWRTLEQIMEASDGKPSSTEAEQSPISTE